MENDIVLFMDGNIQLEVPVSRDGESVWLSANQMAVLFDKDETNIRKHINNVFRSSEVDKNNNTQKMRVDGVKQPVAFYSLDVILAVGYRVNSQRGIAFRKWANNVLKQFILKGYAINEKRLQALKKTVDIQSRMLADALDIEEKDVLRAVNEYTDNELNMEIAEFLLEEKGANITKAWNGQEAVDTFSNSALGEFDAILMDVMMPVVDGYEATKQIRALERADAKMIPIIAMTANAFAEDRLASKEVGMNEHIPKPLDIKLVVKTLASLVTEYREKG